MRNKVSVTLFSGLVMTAVLGTAAGNPIIMHDIAANKIGSIQNAQFRAQDLSARRPRITEEERKRIIEEIRKEMQRLG